MAVNEQNLGETADLSNAPVSATARALVDCAGLTHQGYVRLNNEDHFLLSRFGRYLKPLATNMPPDVAETFEEEGYAMVVADGIGGAAAGELASELAIYALHELVLQTPDWIISAKPLDAGQVMARMAHRFRHIDAVLTEKASEDPNLFGMGTTMTLAASVGTSLVLTHVGDSRAYLLRAGTLYRMTRDHTLAQSLVDQGILEDVEEATTRVRHALTRALGGTGGQCDADVQHLTLADGDKILVCTDGLSDMVDDPSIATLLAAPATAQETCKSLINRALDNGGRDNVTVALCCYTFAQT